MKYSYLLLTMFWLPLSVHAFELFAPAPEFIFKIGERIAVLKTLPDFKKCVEVKVEAPAEIINYVCSKPKPYLEQMTLNFYKEQLTAINVNFANNLAPAEGKDLVLSMGKKYGDDSKDVVNAIDLDDSTEFMCAHAGGECTNRVWDRSHYFIQFVFSTGMKGVSGVHAYMPYELIVRDSSLMKQMRDRYHAFKDEKAKSATTEAAKKFDF